MAFAFSATDPLADTQKLIAQGRGREAAAELRARLDAGRGGLLTRLALVRALTALGDRDGALRQAREAADLNPGIGLAALALGESLLAADALPAAIAEFQRALRLDPGLSEARLAMGRAWLEAGEAGNPLSIFEELEESDQMAPLIARARAMERRARCDPGYVRHLFNQFSADYDRRMLEQLGYAAPEILARLADLVMPGRQALKILDLGCGTGLGGMAFCRRARLLDGIDLSPAMIEKARARGIYRKLVVGDIEQAVEDCYDLILAADTLVYLGDLAALFAMVARHLAAPGCFLFTVEAKDGEGFERGPKRRWRHSEAYIRVAAKEAGLHVAGLLTASPRTEANAPVPGLAIALQRR
ncbi:MAG: methyltransferase domain-containing protein [Rhizomicrobium sp.]